jgi:hypothetical protein
LWSGVGHFGLVASGRHAEIGVLSPRVRWDFTMGGKVAILVCRPEARGTAGRASDVYARRVEAECSFCGATGLEPGYLVDWMQGGARVANWVKGAPEFGPLGGLRILTKQTIPTTAYRCPECSHLELFADDPESESDWRNVVVRQVGPWKTAANR